MEISDSRIDAGKAFDWGRTSEDYARYRDIYPKLFYQKIADILLRLGLRSRWAKQGGKENEG